MLTRMTALVVLPLTLLAAPTDADAQQRSIERTQTGQQRAIERGEVLGQDEAVPNDEGGVAGVEPLTRELVIPAASLTRPVDLTYAPGDYRRIFIAEQRIGTTGRIRVFDTFTNQFLDTAAQPFLNLPSVTTASEQGLLGLAFHPNHAENGHLFVNFTTTSGPTAVTVIRRYTVQADNPNLVDVTSRKNIMTFAQPATNHNGGWIGFGPDGYLYIATGDGGSGNDPWNNAQSLNTLLGKMLRIDVDVDPAAYLVPADNPFVGQAGLDEIWSYGLRNPWRNSFDRATGDLYIGDVGQTAREEFNFQHADSTGGENYGWKCYEGNIVGNSPGTFCPGSPPLVWPFHTYNWSPGVSAIGGYVYRGCDIPTLDGTYVFANYNNGTIWSLNFDRDNALPPSPTAHPAGNHPVTNFTTHNNLGTGVSQITSFGEDANGEIYYLALGGAVHKIVPVTPTIKATDLNCDGVVDGFDLLSLLGEWGECWGCKGDVNGDGVIDGFDLLQLLGDWG